MGFMRFDEHKRLLDTEGKPVHIVGVNYVASYICTNFWEDWRPDRIEQDLKKIAELGLNAVRLPMHWCFMEPERGKYNPVFEREFAAFVEMCRKYKIYMMPWFLVGVATRNYDVPFRNGRSFFCEDMTRAAEAHLKHFTGLYKDEEQIMFWDICDEPEWFSDNPGADKPPYDQQIFASWVKRMYDAIKSADGNHPVTLGFGHIAAGNFGMDLREMSDILDLMSVTAYPYGLCEEPLDRVRNNYTLSYHDKMNSRGKPLFTCESPGYSSVWAGEDMIGRYYKVSMYSNFLNGSTGTLPWAFNDFEEDLWHTPPLEDNKAEPYYGIITVDGRLKPNGQAVRDFAAFAKKADIGRYRPVRPETAILIPEAFHQNARMCYTKLYTYLELIKGCSADVDYVWCTEDFSGYKLLIIPTYVGMGASVWDKIRKYVEDGGTIVHIFGGGRAQTVYSERLFGAETLCLETDYGYNKMIAQGDWGRWHKGDEFGLTGKNGGSILSVAPKGADVLFSFDDGAPAFLRNHYGKGTSYLATMTLDDGLFRIPYRKYMKHDMFGLIDAILEETGISRPVRVSSNALEVGWVKDSDNGNMLLLCINHDDVTVEDVMRIDPSFIPDGWVMRNMDTGEKADGSGIRISLEPAGVAVFTIEPEKK